ncbi:pectate lyase [Flavobacterium sp. Fl-77]|uniref:Pectate lyase n=1 Tax=Flavobacterium flavipigmentatum TaxID=2893884 RepID=A0AAJ2VXQ5_9FLAO|nr:MULTISPECIES: pectate lyase [unclassified Flavobacterium]MDX6181507.1 pectate lyase [Flavobacterium sp. Fl-33]MDX6185459.1 pectate lyase [Flavobacterium sp. Fl-77]UFH37562.1 pectate lyase [Flavobacterium sp. F-70]
MKKNLILLFFLLNLSPLFAHNYYIESPEGFGAKATGGSTSNPITVASYEDLVAKIKSNSPEVILVSGTITIPSGKPIQEIVTNKSIIGLPGAKLVNENQSNPGAGILYLKSGSNNVIIRNLVFIGPGSYDIDGQDNLTADCTNLWVDHCEFQDGQDGNFDNKGKTDNVTISWCKFTYLKGAKLGGFGGADDHSFSNLIGSNKNDFPADGHYSITFKNCYWAKGCKQRMPRARNAELHILNCYFNTSESGSLAIGLGGGVKNTSCYIESTDFAKVDKVFRGYTSTDGGTVGIAFSNCRKGPMDFGTPVNKPSYNYTTIPLGKVEEYVTNTSCGAGATLQVSSTGVISTSCKQ